MPHLDASALERDVDGVALLAAALGIPVPEPMPEAAPVYDRAPARIGLQVLVVESDWLLRESISIQLHLRGHVVLQADTGDRALATIRGGQTIDVLLTEADTVADPSGWVLAEEARRQHPSVAVIYTSAERVSLTPEVSGSVFVAKPYRTEHILEAIQQLTSEAPLDRVTAQLYETSSDMDVLSEAA